MSKSTILEIPMKDFELTKFINEIGKNLESEIDPSYAALYVRSSRIEEGIFVQLFEDEINPEYQKYDTYEEEFLNIDDMILYVRFVIDSYGYESMYLCGDGTTFKDEDYKNVDYGDFVNDDSGFIITYKDEMLTIQKATYGSANPYEYVVRVVENAGDFDKLMVNFLNRFIKK